MLTIITGSSLAIPDTGIVVVEPTVVGGATVVVDSIVVVGATVVVDSTVVVGATCPVNISYPESEDVHVLDMGEIDREYSPIRIVQDERIDRKNESLMSMTPEIVTVLLNTVTGKE